MLRCGSMRVPVLAALLLLAPPAAAQEASPTSSPAPGLLHVFLDCPGCDFDYVREQIPFVSWVREREDAEVHVLVTTQPTGGGGAEWTAAFLGKGAFAGHDDRLVYTSTADDTQDQIRQGLAKVLELGLVGYAAHSTAAGALSIGYEAPPATAAGAVTDPWNAWVYRVAVYGDLRGQQSLHSQSERATVSANRVTDGWKLHANADADYSQDTFHITGAIPSKYVSITRSYSTYEQAVKSLGPHTSVAATFSAGRYDSYNEAGTATGGGGFEWDVFPYSESTRRLLTLRYELDYGWWRYEEPTIYGYTWQAMPSETLSAQTDMTQPWGSMSFSASAKNYFPDPKQHELSGFAYLNLRVFKGLSLSVLTEVSLLHDQFYLPSGGATEQEILLQRRELQTSYDYYTTIGIAYSFGSISNDVVNPRFGGGTTTIVF